VKIWASRYALKSRASLGGHALSQERHGALLKIEERGLVGYADLHPWTELGDESLDQQLKLLSENQTTALSVRSLMLARMDLDARARSVSAFSGLMIPNSHYLATDLRSLSTEELTEAWADGFRTIKLKLGRNLGSEIEKLHVLEKALSAFRLRFDFNSLLNAKSFSAFIECLPPALVETIELVEDPIPWNSLEWAQVQEQTGVAFALDRVSAEELSTVGESQTSFRWMVVKPAVQEPKRMAALAAKLGAKVFVTSYLDHPVGQSGAALEAARLGVFETCGLVSSRAFVTGEFSERLIWMGPEFIPAEGTGIGFDDLLEKQDWLALT
jgi:o-succinylbenzoate synthase